MRHAHTDCTISVDTLLSYSARWSRQVMWNSRVSTQYLLFNCQTDGFHDGSSDIWTLGSYVSGTGIAMSYVFVPQKERKHSSGGSLLRARSKNKFNNLNNAPCLWLREWPSESATLCICVWGVVCLRRCVSENVVFARACVCVCDSACVCGAICVWICVSAGLLMSVPACLYLDLSVAVSVIVGNWLCVRSIFPLLRASSLLTHQ